MMDKIHLGNGKHRKISDINAPKAFKILRGLPEHFRKGEFTTVSGLAPATAKLYLKWLIKNHKVEKRPDQDDAYQKININAGTRYTEPAHKKLL